MPPRWQPVEVTLAPPVRGEDLALAAALGIAVAGARDPSGWQLVRTVRGTIALHSPAAMGDLGIELDPGSGALGRRLRGCRRDDPLARAIGLPQRQEPPSVFDATAGLARDAMVLAQLGCRVTGCERVPAFVLLVRAALAGTRLAERLQVEAGDAAERLRQLADDAAPDVVYLDPMFDDAGSAQVKKEMQVCRALAAPPDDAAALLQLARGIARQRVVVKRHPHLAPLADGVSFRIDGNRVRFDVYLTAPAATPPR